MIYPLVNSLSLDLQFNDCFVALDTYLVMSYILLGICQTHVNIVSTY